MKEFLNLQNFSFGLQFNKILQDHQTIHTKLGRVFENSLQYSSRRNDLLPNFEYYFAKPWRYVTQLGIAFKKHQVWKKVTK